MARERMLRVPGRCDDPSVRLPRALLWLLWALWLGCLVFAVWFFVTVYLAMTDV